MRREYAADEIDSASGCIDGMPDSYVLNEEDGALISCNFPHIDVREQWVTDATGSYWDTWAGKIRTMADLRGVPCAVDM